MGRDWRSLKGRALNGVGMTALAVFAASATSTTALAQTVADQSTAGLVPNGPSAASQAQTAAATAGAGASDIVVTGTRVVRDGFTSPTPITVFGAADIARVAAPNIADAVNQLPQLQGSTTPATNNRMVSAGIGGGNVLNLRSLGAPRTLVLLDGRRVVPTSGMGTTDINNIPSELIQRVDVVTGGASAAYGSDAVAGVVNFILDKHYTGVKGTIQGGISSRGDALQSGGNLTYGGNLSDRLHLLLSVEYQRNVGINGIDPSKRTWYQSIRQVNNPAFISRTATPNVPALITYANVYHSLAAPGGLITSGPLRGTQFGVGGTPSPFVYGSPIFGQGMIGGQREDTSDEVSFVTDLTYATAFGRLDYDITSTTKAFLQVNYGNSIATGGGGAKGRFFGNLTMNSANPFIPASIRPALIAAGPTFGYGLNSSDLGIYVQRNKRQTFQAVAGLEGKVFSDWSWNAFYQFGRSSLDWQVRNNLLSQNFKNAIDVITGPGGAPVCRSVAVNPTCVPLNIFGVGVASQPAIDYVTGVSQTKFHVTQQVAEASINGEPFRLPAGAVSLVVGAGWRREQIATQYVDPNSLINTFATADFKPTNGHYTVKEVFAETVIPILKGGFLANSLELNAAGRVTNYSTSGTVETWKGGINYRPFADLLLRGTRSRDIRAPNLSELYAGGNSQVQPNALDPKYGNGLIASFPNVTQGNAALKPEIADTLSLGAVYQPSWFRGFSASFDYYNIDIKKGIGTVPLQTVINDCFTGLHPEYCAQVVRGPGFVGGVAQPNTVIGFTTIPINLAAYQQRGYDIEVSYRKKLSDWNPSWGGAISLRSLATHVLRNRLDNGLGTVHEFAGEVNNLSNSPRWRVNTDLSYTGERLTLSATWRWTSSGVLYTSFYDTASGPLTVDQNNVPAVSYFDFGISYRIPVSGKRVELFARVMNAFDKDPPVVTNTNLYDVQYNPFLYDGVGRYFRAGLRFAL